MRRATRERIWEICCIRPWSSSESNTSFLPLRRIMLQITKLECLNLYFHLQEQFMTEDTATVRPEQLRFQGTDSYVYCKITSLTGKERVIVHLLPGRLEVLFLKYLLYIRSLERLLTGALYKTENEILFGHQQYLFSGYKGRFGAGRLRRIVAQQTAASTTLHSSVSVQELRQALVAFLDQHAGNSKADTGCLRCLAHILNLIVNDILESRRSQDGS
ncbi:hypothetical protein V1525DRAFT_169801 [Lipomyces kononenkoae]|uniref:Uncharacterized protein n=1 Tax=Lipomyces kononenkoae TaxID=34357 RepID=A0ACC3SZY6_LIPKO